MYKAVVNCFSGLGQKELCDGLKEKAEGDTVQSTILFNLTGAVNEEWMSICAIKVWV